MKKLTIIALALCLAVVMAAPVMAVDADFSGEYRVRGFYTEHYDLDKDSANNAFMNMRFQLQTVFKATDNLSVTARFDALDDHVWGTTTDGSGEEGNVDFHRAYMTIKAPVGKFIIGRAGTGYWGTSFVDSETDGTDCIKFIKKIDNLTLYAVFMKLQELDESTATDKGDRDEDRYDLRFKYKMENVTSGLLLAFLNNKTVDTQTTHTYVAMPYFVGKFGPLDIQGELAYKWGETDKDTAADIDIKKLAYNLEATYNFGPASVMAGYAFVSGDNDDATENSAYGHVGADWEKLFILTYDEAPVNNLGGVGNLSQTSDYGAKIIYGGANFSPLDNLKLGVVVGSADADKTQLANQEDDYGVEYDLTLNWNIYDNLSYSAIAAFLSAGDLWKGGVPATQIEDTYALFHQLQLTF